jgi:hypothetical protein
MSAFQAGLVRQLARALPLYFTAAVGLLLNVTSAQAQSPPMILSVTPSDLSENVATNTSIVFVFDRDMTTSVFPIASVPGVYNGNFAIQPTNLSISGKWSADKRTLTIKSSTGWPYETNVVWTLNPPGAAGVTALPRFKSSTGQELATTSGSFTTAAPPPPPPQLISVTPTNQATEISPTASIVFVFDEDMDTSVLPQTNSGSVFGNFGVSPSGFYLGGSWGADKRTLTLPCSGLLPLGVSVSWGLNPPGVANPFRNSAGIPLDRVLGSFTVINNTGGDPNENCTIFTNTQSGYYTFVKTLQTQRQISASASTVDTNSAASFFLIIQDVPKGRLAAAASFDAGRVTNGTLTLPSGGVLQLTNEVNIVINGVTNHSGKLGLFLTNTIDSDVEANLPNGDYDLRLDQVDYGEGAATLPLPAAPNIPLIANLDQAQTIDPAQNFTLTWNSIAPAAGPSVSVKLSDQYGKLVFAAPNACVQRTLDLSATSVLIPAATLKPNLTYEGQLVFTYRFYDVTNQIPEMIGIGQVSRATSFEIKTGAAGAITVIAPQLGSSGLTNGFPEFTIQGTPGVIYTIERTDDLANTSWSNVGTLKMDASGAGVFIQPTDRLLSFPLYYRAVGP